MNRICFSVLALSAASLSNAQYSLSQLQTRPGLTFQYEVAVSNHGNYMIALSEDTKGIPHYLLYGPDFTKEPQDLNTSAGPTPKTPAPWNGVFVAVNDKGHCVAYQSLDQFSANLFFYSHETHTLTQIPAASGTTYLDGPYAGDLSIFSISANDTVAGTLVFNYSNGNWSNSRPFRWSPTTGLKRLFTGTTNYGSSTGINDKDFQIGTITNPNPNDPNDNGFLYLDGPVNEYAYGSSSWGTGPAAINDSLQIAGDAYGPSGVSAFYEYNPTNLYNVPILLGSYSYGADDYASAIDNFGRVFGLESYFNYNNYSYERYAVLWQGLNPGQVPVPVQNLVPANAAPNATSWSFRLMDLNGTIYGSFTDGYGTVHPVTLTP